MTDRQQPYDLGPYFCENPHHALLHHVLDNVVGHWPHTKHGHPGGQAHGVALEFGTGDGASARCIARYLPVYTFGSSDGLPEDWRPGFPKGSFAQQPIELPGNAVHIEGLFQDTLPSMHWDGMQDVKLIHIDCDLYSSTNAVLTYLPWKHLARPFGKEKPVIVFDEFHGFPGAELHEHRAWREFAEDSGIEWKVIGHGHEQWGIQLV